MTMAIGMKVECNFEGAGEWYPGTIAALAGETIGIAYADGDKETTRQAAAGRSDPTAHFFLNMARRFTAAGSSSSGSANTNWLSDFSAGLLSEFCGFQPKGSDMLKSVSKRHIVRATANSSQDKFGSKFIYSGCYTLEPPLVEDAWDTLGQDTFALEIAAYPKVFHRAFLAELRKRAKHA
jgi:hypothetical protein